MDSGILLIDKPKEWTSFDAVNKVRHTITNAGLNGTGKKRFPVGHTGTLDPLATGLLVLLLGKDTKHAPDLTKLDKTYEVEMCLGQTSSTGDEEGVKTPANDLVPSKEQIEQQVHQFVGEISQIPPAFSAVKIGGVRAYKLARAGQEVKIEPRQVKIYSITDITYDYPKVRFTVEVSSGTYIRTLVEDIGKSLSTGAYMSDLRRTRVGKFNIKDALPAGDISAESVKSHAKQFTEL
jgi:tRNA pseudouridine55 synthase